MEDRNLWVYGPPLWIGESPCIPLYFRRRPRCTFPLAPTLCQSTFYRNFPIGPAGLQVCDICIYIYIYIYIYRDSTLLAIELNSLLTHAGVMDLRLTIFILVTFVTIYALERVSFTSSAKSSLVCFNCMEVIWDTIVSLEIYVHDINFHIFINNSSLGTVPALASVTPLGKIFHGASFKIKNANIIYIYEIFSKNKKKHWISS